MFIVNIKYTNDKYEQFSAEDVLINDNSLTVHFDNEKTRIIPFNNIYDLTYKKVRCN